jgi:hypothetical protein
MVLSRFPEEIDQKYNLNSLAVDGLVYIEIRKGMYGLKQAGLLANQLLQTRLAPFGYYPARHTPGLWLQLSTWASNMQSISGTPYCEPIN